MVKVIVCDIDNTLVPKHKLPSERTLECIKEFNKRGILFGLASGRSTKGLTDLANNWGIHCDLLIGMNGGEILDNLNGEHKQICCLKKEWLQEIFKVMEPFKDDVNPSIQIGDKRYVRKIDKMTAEAFKYSKVGNKPIIAEDESIFWSQDLDKIGFRLEDPSVMPRIEEHVAKFPNENWYGVKTEYTMYEFNQSTADKGKMLEYFCKNHDIDIKDTMAFGDMDNDIPLLRSAGVAVCMENGAPNVKAVADLITEKSIEDDGWSDFVINHILNK